MTNYNNSFITSMKRILVHLFASLIGRFPKMILQLRYFRHEHRFINWSHPRELQEWILSNYIKDCDDKKYLNLYTMLTDKYRVRQWVRERIGDQYLTKCLAVWDSANDIDFLGLPTPFVLKTNNGCGTNMIVRNDRILNIESIKSKIGWWLRFPYGALTGQKHYSAINPCIIAEEYLEQHPGASDLPDDYKFFCVNGVPIIVLHYEGRKINSHICQNTAFDMNWQPLTDATLRKPKAIPAKPISFEEMKLVAQQLSKGFRFVRVDLYEILGKPIFGEMTFSPDVLSTFTYEFRKKLIKKFK